MKENKITLETLDELLNYKYLETSYKIFWTEVILEQVIKGKTKIYFKDMAIEMIVNAWDPVVNKGITFGRLDRLSRIIQEIQETWHIEEGVEKDSLRKMLQDVYDEKLQSITEELYEDTPYRLLEPLYEKQLKGKKDSAKNTLIKELCAKDSKSIYTVNEQERSVTINPLWIQFIKSNKKIVLGWIRDKFAYFLERKAMKR